MSEITVDVILALIAGVLAVVELFRSQGRSLLAWAILALAATFLIT